MGVARGTMRVYPTGSDMVGPFGKQISPEEGRKRWLRSVWEDCQIAAVSSTGCPDLDKLLVAKFGPWVGLAMICDERGEFHKVYIGDGCYETRPVVAEVKKIQVVDRVVPFQAPVWDEE